MAGTLLLVHDDLGTIASVRRLLGREGYEVVLATSAHDALVAWSQRRPAALILFTAVDGGQGGSVLEMLAERAEGHPPPVILYGEPVPGFDVPALPLPFDGNALLQAVAERLATSDTSTEPPLPPPAPEGESDSDRELRELEEEVLAEAARRRATRAQTVDVPRPPPEPEPQPSAEEAAERAWFDSADPTPTSEPEEGPLPEPSPVPQNAEVEVQSAAPAEATPTEASAAEVAEDSGEPAVEESDAARRRAEQVAAEARVQELSLAQARAEAAAEAARRRIGAARESQEALRGARERDAEEELARHAQASVEAQARWEEEHRARERLEAELQNMREAMERARFEAEAAEAARFEVEAEAEAARRAAEERAEQLRLEVQEQAEAERRRADEASELAHREAEARAEIAEREAAARAEEARRAADQAQASAEEAARSAQAQVHAARLNAEARTEEALREVAMMAEAARHAEEAVAEARREAEARVEAARWEAACAAEEAAQARYEAEARLEAARLETERATQEALEAARREASSQIEAARLEAERAAEEVRQAQWEAQELADAVRRQAEMEVAQAREEAEARVEGQLRTLMAERERRAMDWGSDGGAPFPLRGSVPLADWAGMWMRLCASSGETRVDLHRDGVQRSLWLAGGRLVAAASSAPEESLLAAARRSGLLDLRQERELRPLKAVSPSEVLKFLRERGFLREPEVVPLLQSFAEGVAVRALSATEVAYALADEHPGPEAVALPSPIEGQALLAEAIRRTLGSESMPLEVARDAVPVFRLHPAGAEALSLSDPERRVLSAIDGESTARSVWERAQVSRDEGVRALALLQNLGFVELSSPAAAFTSGEPLSSEQGVERLSAKFREIQEGDYFAILELPRTAGALDVQRAFQRLAAEFHPLAFSGHSDPGLLYRAEQIQEVLREAAHALYDDQLRAQYAQSLAPA